MSATIWKYPLNPGVQRILMPEAATILTAQMQADEPQLWVKLDPARRNRERRIAVVGTGHAAPDDDSAYVATFQMGPLVWHVFDGGYVESTERRDENP